jgi:DNA polymerase-3 subunit epsilon
MREIILDTETTGLNPAEGDRIIEIGALEMMNHVPTGKTFHIYINPECEIGEDATKIHGITNDRVANEPVFAEIVDDFLNFIGDAPLVIHNAPFDMSFINAELKKCGRPALPDDRAIDTLVMARGKFPGGQASLDALCKKFGIDNSHRDLHGAMVDTDLLADVYIELLGGKQPGLSLIPEDQTVAEPLAQTAVPQAGKHHRPARQFTPSDKELKAHQQFIDELEDPLWKTLDTLEN